MLGYKIYYGNASGNYTTNINAGNVTQYTVAGLDDLQAWYFAATADAGATESRYSNEAFVLAQQQAIASATHIIITWQQVEEPPPVAIAHVQSVSYYAASGAYPGNVVAGNLLVVGVSGAPAPTGVSNTGTCGVQSWTQAVAHAEPPAYLRIYWAIASGSGSCSISVAGGSDIGFTAHEYSGVAASSPIDATAVSTVSSTANPTTAALSTSVAGCLLFAYWADESTGQASISARSGYTENERGENLSHYHWAGDTIAGAAGSYTAGCTLASTANSWCMAQVAFKPATGGSASILRQMLAHH